MQVYDYYVLLCILLTLAFSLTMIGDNHGGLSSIMHPNPVPSVIFCTSPFPSLRVSHFETEEMS